MKPYVISVDFRLNPGRLAEFVPLMKENARLSEANEPGCRRFDVLLPVDGGDRVRLYEIYDSEAAFDAHRRTPHYLAFKERTQGMIAQTVVERFELPGE
jgi:quinol monooxygenase YgiN